MYGKPGAFSLIAWNRGAMIAHFELHGFVPMKSNREDVTTVAISHAEDKRRTAMLYRGQTRGLMSAALPRNDNWTPIAWDAIEDSELRRALSLLYRHGFIPGASHVEPTV